MRLLRTVASFGGLLVAHGAIAQTSDCIRLGGGMVHCDSIGPNGSMSSTNCIGASGAMVHCDTTDLSSNRRAQDGTPNANDGSSLSFVGDLIARSQERSFQRKVGQLMASGDCNGAAVFALSKGRYDMSDQIRRSCIAKPDPGLPTSPTIQEFMAAPPVSAPVNATATADGQDRELAFTPNQPLNEGVTEADRWVRFSTNGAGSIYYYKTKPRRIIDGSLEVLVLADRSADRTIKARTSKLLYQVYCSDQSIRELQSTEYDKGGNAVSWYDQPDKIVRAIPDTVGGSLLNSVCTTTP